MATEEERVAAIGAAIEAYLRAHPDAADSIDGIRLWWLTGVSAEEAPDCIRKALERLEAAGVVEKREIPGTQAVYRAARAHK
jgi:hypothetical protein